MSITFEGIECIKCGTTTRYNSNKACVKCKLARNKTHKRAEQKAYNEYKVPEMYRLTAHPAQGFRQNVWSDRGGF